METSSVYEVQYLDVSMLSADDDEQSGSSVFPNPVTGNGFNIVSKMAIAKINVYDQQGNIVISREMTNTNNIYSIEVPAHLANGIYYYELLDANGKYFEKGKIAIVR
jgi:hypothetical protein